LQQTATKLPILLTAVLTLPFEMKQVNLFITAAMYALKVMTIITDKDYSKCSVFAFTFEHTLKQSCH